MNYYEEDNTPEKSDRWEGFLTNIGQGIALILVVIAIIMLYRGCNGMPTLLPPIQ